jgi:hypothetical protein
MFQTFKNKIKTHNKTRKNKPKKGTDIRKQRYPPKTIKILPPIIEKNGKENGLTLYKCKKQMTDTESRKYRGYDVSPEMVKTYKIINEDFIVRDYETGRFILAYKKNALNNDIIDGAIKDLRSVAILSGFRGDAAGKVDFKNIKKNISNLANADINPNPNVSWAEIKRKSTGSRIYLSNYVKSGNIGFYNRVKLGFREADPPTEATSKFLENIGEVIKDITPKVHKCYMDMVPKKYRYGGDKSPFTTITVNENFRTSMHVDKGNIGCETGFKLQEDASEDHKKHHSAISVLTASYINSPYEGAALIFPQYSIGVPLTRGDILVADVNLLHGNEPINFKKDGTRISFVLYVRENIINP